MKLLALLVGIPAAVLAESIVTLKMLNTVFKPCGVENAEFAKGQSISCARALPHINRALREYKLVKPAQVAFYLSIMAVESGNLTYNRNVWPGRAGQGTRSMMMPNNLYKFFTSSPRLEKNKRLRKLAKAPYNESDDKAKEKALKVMMKDKYTFLPGAWWIAKGAEMLQPGCKKFAKTLKKEIKPPTLDALLKSCVGVDPDDARRRAFQTALRAVKKGSKTRKPKRRSPKRGSKTRKSHKPSQ